MAQVAAPHIYAEAKKCVSFIFLNEKGRAIPIGTGFFVSVPLEENPTTWIVYFVTARHVLETETNRFSSPFYLRLNLNSGDSEFIRMEPTPQSTFTHTDVDIVVFTLGGVDPKRHDVKWVPLHMVSDRETVSRLGITEGDDVFFSGLFTSHIGQKKNQPILRFGKVALISDEKIEWKEKGKDPKMLELYLVELQSFGGNSGSPVFFYLGPTRQPSILTLGPPQIWLAGIMKGTFLSANEINIEDTKRIQYSLESVGIAAVIPAYQLREILLSETLLLQRKRAAEEMKEKVTFALQSRVDQP
jgi:hypothetical protein